LRDSQRHARGVFRVTKNTLAKRAIKGTAFEHLEPLFTGPTAIGFSSDPVAAPKAIVDFAKKNDKLKIIGGGLDGSLLTEAQVKALAELPSLDELRAKLLALLNTPATRIAGILQAPGGQIARVLKAHAEKV